MTPPSTVRLGRHRRRDAARTLVALVVAAGSLAVATGHQAHATTAPATTAPAAANKLPGYGTIWVTSQGNNSLLEFARGAKGESRPIRDVHGTATKLDDPAGVVLDRRGRVWVANFASKAITAYGARANGNSRPLMKIAGARTKLDRPLGLAMSRAGNLWVADSGKNSVLEFAAGAHGNVAPIRTIHGSRTRLHTVTGIAVNAAGTRVWITEKRVTRTTPALEEFSGASHGNVRPLTRISGGKSQLDSPFGIAVGQRGNNPTTDNADPRGTFAVLSYAAGAHGKVAPPRVISGPATGLSLPTLIAADAVGAIWVPNQFNNTLVRFAPSQRGDAAPIETIFGGATKLSDPTGVAVFSAPPSAPRAVRSQATHKLLRITWRAPLVAGGGILGYVVRKATKKSGPWTTVARTTSRSYRKRHPHHTFFYDVEAFNNAGVSAASHPTKPKG